MLPTPTLRTSRRLRTTTALALTGLIALLFLTAAPGCKKIRRMLPATTVDAPEAGSPEAVVREALDAAMEPDEATGWSKFKGLLHSEQLGPASLHSWRSLNFQSLRRKWPLYVYDDKGEPCSTTKHCNANTPPVFKESYTESAREGEEKIFVENQGNPDNPTPCKLKRDPKANNEWKIYICSL